MRTHILIVTAWMCGSAAVVSAQTFDIRPGLWEVSSNTQMSGMPIPNLDQMTPEQRARVEAAMKGMANGMSHTEKSCVTRESIEKMIARASSNQNNACAPKIASMTSSKVELHIDCKSNKGDQKSTGEVIIERRDAEHFTGSGSFKANGANGRIMDVKMTMSGKFLSSDCGDVKPNDK